METKSKQLLNEKLQQQSAIILTKKTKSEDNIGIQVFYKLHLRQETGMTRKSLQYARSHLNFAV